MLQVKGVKESKAQKEMQVGRNKEEKEQYVAS